MEGRELTAAGRLGGVAAAPNQRTTEDTTTTTAERSTTDVAILFEVDALGNVQRGGGKEFERFLHLNDQERQQEIELEAVHVSCH